MDEVQLRAERSDGVVLCNPTHHLNLFSSQCTPATPRNKKGAGEPTTCLGREPSLKSSEIDLDGSLPSISPCSVAPLVTYLSLTFWRAQMATRITTRHTVCLFGTDKPCSLHFTHRHVSPVPMFILNKHIHKPSSVSKYVPKHNHKQKPPH